MTIKLPKSVFKRYHSNKHFSVLPTRWRRKPAGIDMEQNYATVTLCRSVGTYGLVNGQLNLTEHGSLQPDLELT